MDMREQFHIYTPRKSGEIIQENSTFKYKENVNDHISKHRRNYTPNTMGKLRVAYISVVASFQGQSDKSELDYVQCLLPSYLFDV